MNNHFSKIFSEIIGKLEIEEIFNKQGKPHIYSTKSIIKSFLIMVAYRLTSVRSLSRFLSEHPKITENCQQEVNHLISVVSKATWLLEEDKKYELIADSGFDAQYNYDWCKKINIRFTCPLNQGNKIKGERLKRQKFYKSKIGKKLYKRRTDIERLNGHLKDLFLIDPFPVRQLKNVNTFLNLAMLCYLAGVYYNFTNRRNLREIKSLIA